MSRHQTLGLEADWPAPRGVRVLSTFRGACDLHAGNEVARGSAAGRSQAPYRWLNLGDHVGDDPVAVAENRRYLKAAAALPAEPVWLTQVHGVNVADLDAGRGGAGLGGAGLGGVGVRLGPADAAVTQRANTVCAILTADCLPVVFASEAGDAIAAAHAGWRGLAAGVIGATLRAMAVAPERVLAWLGPAIGPEHFEVGGEVREAFLETDAGADAAFRANERGRFMADLALLARRQLASLGVRRVYGGGECTYARAERYFSHRRDGVTGRQATLIWREG